MTNRAYTIAAVTLAACASLCACARQPATANDPAAPNQSAAATRNAADVQSAAPTRNGADVAMTAVRADAIRAHMRFLSSSLLKGREPGTPGYAISAEYIAAELEAIGIRPAGTSGSWFQPIRFRRSAPVASGISFRAIRDGQSATLTYGTDYITGGLASATDLSVDAPLAFVGFGVTAPEFAHDDYAGIDVRGKVVVTIFGAPTRFGASERAYFSDGAVKARTAIAHGATGILTMLSPEDRKRWAWNWMAPQIEAGDMNWLDEAGVPHDAFPELRGWVALSPSGAERIFAGAPKTLDQVFAAARAGEAQAFALPSRVQIHTVSRHTSVDSPNVVGVRQGSDPQLRQEFVVYTAHLDHLGLCPPVKGDNVCHGACDNASGAAALLEVARAFAALPQPPRRSVLFVFVTGEELGLLGSDYFARHPTVPIAGIVANINIDGAAGLLYPLRDVVALGAEHSSLNQVIVETAGRMGYEVSPDPMPEEAFFIRVDGYSFAQQGVPPVSIFDGFKSTDPKVDGKAAQEKWLTTVYHTPADNMEQVLDYASAAKSTRLQFLVGHEIAQRTPRPTWNANDFFGTKFAGKKKD
jgi:Zn-dependent M28 family amino/carboxypeptidase